MTELVFNYKDIASRMKGDAFGFGNSTSLTIDTGSNRALIALPEPVRSFADILDHLYGDDGHLYGDDGKR